MWKIFQILLIFVEIVNVIEIFNNNILNDDFMRFLNKQNSTWKAAHNFHINTSVNKLNFLFGVHENTNLYLLSHTINHFKSTLIPKSFDARKQWPHCADVISNLRDQAGCGSCWAFGAVEAMSDRICIFSNGRIKVSLSSQDIISCCEFCGFGCQGGFISAAWQYWNLKGIVTENFHLQKGCKSYSFAPCEHFMNGERPICRTNGPTPQCLYRCDDGNACPNDQRFFGTAYNIPGNDVQMQIEIMKNGPIEVHFVVYLDFVYYKSGVYQHIAGKKLGRHAVKVIGWGIEGNIPYWLAINSWNTDWGDNGYFKFLRGSNHCGIENGAVAGIPQFSK